MSRWNDHVDADGNELEKMQCKLGRTKLGYNILFTKIKVLLIQSPTMASKTCCVHYWYVQVYIIKL